MITTLRDFRIFEKKQKNAGIDVVVVDVQAVFDEYIGAEFIAALTEFCEDYKRVFQIWDSTKSDKPDYVFPNQVATYEKKYAWWEAEDTSKRTGPESVEMYFPEAMWSEVRQKLEAIPNAGDMFETMYGDVWVYIGNDHKWFLCPKQLVDLFGKFKSLQRQVILVGGAKNECIEDVYTAMKAMGVNVSYNMDLVFSKDGNRYLNQVHPAIKQ